MKKRGLRTLSLIIAVLIALGVCGISAFAETGETVLFYDDFENGLSDMWNTSVSSDDLGTVKTEQSNIYRTTGSGTDTIMLKDGNWNNISFNTRIKAAEWSSDESSYVALYLRYADALNYHMVKYSNGTFTVSQLKAGTESILGSAQMALSSNTAYDIAFEAKHGVIRFMVNNVVLIQDYCHSVTSGTIGITTNNQSVDFYEVAANRETVNIRQDFKTGSYVMTHSSATSAGIGLSALTSTHEYDNTEGALHITGAGSLTLYDTRWGWTSLGTDWKNTETVSTFKIENIGDGITFRTSFSNNPIQNSYVTQFTSAGIYKTINANFSGARTKTSLTNLTADGKYHTLKIKNVTNTDNTVTCTITIDNNETYSWTDDTGSAIVNGGGFQITCSGSAKMYIKNIEISDVSASSDSLCSEKFDNLDNWTVTGNGTAVQVSNTSDNFVYATTTAQNEKLILNDKKWKNVSVSCDIKSEQWVSGSTYQDAYAAIYVRYADEANNIMLCYSPISSSGNFGTMFILQNIAGVQSIIDSVEVEKFGTESHKITIEVKGGNFRALLDGSVVLEAQANQTSAKTIGTIALQSKNQGVLFDNISVEGEKHYYYEGFDGDVLHDFSTYVSYLADISGVYVRTSGTNYGIEDDNGISVLHLDRAAYNIYSNTYEGKTWNHTKFNVRVKTNNWTGVHIRSRHIPTSNTSYLLYISNASTWQIRRNGDYATVLASATLASSLSTTNYEKISLETVDNADGTVTLTGYRNDTAVINYTDNGSNLPSSLVGKYPNLATNGNGNSITFVNQANNYIDYINIEDMNVSSSIKAMIATDKTSLVGNETVTGSFVVSNNTYETGNAMLIMALYDADMTLKDISVNYVTTETEKTTTYTDAMQISSDIAQGWSLKLFAWNGYDKMQPIGSSIAIAK